MVFSTEELERIKQFKAQGAPEITPEAPEPVGTTIRQAPEAQVPGEISQFERIQKTLGARQAALTALPPQVTAIQSGADPIRIQELTSGSPQLQQILQRLQERGVEEAAPTGPLERVAAGAAERFERVEAGLERQIAGEQVPISTAIQAIGETVGVATDVLFETIKTVTPDFIKRGLEAGAREVLDTELGKAGIEALKGGLENFEQFEEENPESGANIRAVFNIGSVLPITKAAQVGAKVTARGAGRAGRALEEAGEAAVVTEKGEFLRELVRPVQTKKVKEAQVARTREVGVGPFKRSIIEPTRQEVQIEEVLKTIPGVDPGKTVQQNFNVIATENVKRAEKLISDLKANDVAFTRTELNSRLRSVRETLADDPDLVGDAAKSADKVLAKFEKIMDAKKNKGSELLEARKELDRFLNESTGGKIFAEGGRIAPTEKAARAIRREINEFLDEKAVDVNVKQSLRDQSALFNAMERLTPKAAIEADTAFGRVLQRTGELLGTKNKIVQGIAAAVGIGGLGAAATFAPAAAALGLVGLTALKTGKLIASPKVKIQMGKLLQEVEKALKKATGDTKVELNSLKTELGDLLVE